MSENPDFKAEQQNATGITEILMVLIISVSIILCVQYHWKRWRLYRMAAKIPGPIGYPLIGSALMFVGSTESNTTTNSLSNYSKYFNCKKNNFAEILLTVMNLMDSYKAPIKLWVGPRLYFATSLPEHFDIIFNHPKTLGKDDSYKCCLSMVGEGLFSAPGMYH